MDSRVVDSRLVAGGTVTWRRRACDACGRRFTTYERVEELMPEVVKRDGRREPYQRAKLLEGLKSACEKRPVPATALDDLVSRVERALVELGEREVASERIGNQVRDELRKLDPIAWLRFSSVYLDFGTIEEFRSALDEYETKRGRD